jgi:hypothetical protein
MACLTYLRNWIHFHNPLWPITYKSRWFPFQWPGVSAFGEMDFNRPLADVYGGMAAIPVPGKDFADTRISGYGIAVPFLLLPLGAVISALVAISGARWAVRRFALRLPDDEDATRTAYALLVILLSAYASSVSMALWAARYNIHLVAGLLLLVAWASGVSRGRRLADSVASVAIIAFLVNLWWAQPGWGLDVESAIAFAKLPPDRRAVHAASEWSISDQVAEAREAELGPGSVVAFTDDCTFPGALWNEHYSNRLEFVPSALGANGVLARVDELKASWFVVGVGSALHSVIRSHPERWQEIGLASRGFPTAAFRRIGERIR